MKKSVLISIQPKWVEKIANGQKTVEVRKARPKLETPFRCYIYCTQDRSNTLFRDKEFYKLIHFANFKFDKEFCDCQNFNGKVIGEFACDKIEQFIDYDEHNKPYWNFTADLKEIERVQKETCLTLEQIIDYVGDSKNAYGWHISDLKIYDKPKELKEFFRPCPVRDGEFGDCGNCDYCIWGEYSRYCTNNLTRPPQSWCYCESLGVV